MFLFPQYLKQKKMSGRIERGMTPFLVTWTFPPSRSKQLAAKLENIIPLLEQFSKTFTSISIYEFQTAVATISTLSLSLSRARVTLCEALVKK